MLANLLYNLIGVLGLLLFIILLVWAYYRLKVCRCGVRGCVYARYTGEQLSFDYTHVLFCLAQNNISGKEIHAELKALPLDHAYRVALGLESKKNLEKYFSLVEEKILLKIHLKQHGIEHS
jgi:hypothetical protein